ncbi:AMP-binding protein [Rhodococcus wratislaviensis]|uniref:AMP-binding protein n=1 Tax=Rhodococcus wratislaviensis TaxID=44752 RepID=UPI0035155034
MVIQSPFPDVEIPDVSVYDYLFGRVDTDDAAKPALVDGETNSVTTYRELIDQVNAIAGALAFRGLRSGDVVGVLSPNTPAFASALHGILRAGGTATTINALYTAEDIATQLHDSNTKFLFTTTALLPQARQAAVSAGIAETNLVLLDDTADGSVLSVRTFLTEQRSAPEISIDPATHLAVLPYSSGTTGSPKGVMLTHRNLVANISQLQPLARIERDDSLLAVLPFFHIYGLTVLLNAALHARATIVTMPRFDLSKALGTVATHKCTYLFVAPPIALALAKEPVVDEYDLSSVHTVFSGAASLSEDLAHKVADRLKCRVRQGYGMSELSPVSHAIPTHPYADDIALSSVGLPLPNTENKLVDPNTGAEIDQPDIGISAPGELWVRGPNVMVGYLANPDATAETVDAEGFLHTGDLATVDADGVITIVDRLKELIKYKGYQVPPAELEALLLRHSMIADAAVIGVLDENGEEIPKAFVVRHPNTELTEADVLNFVDARVSPHKRVRRVEFIDAVPKSAAGKILRNQLRSAPASAVR